MLRVLRTRIRYERDVQNCSCSRFSISWYDGMQKFAVPLSNDRYRPSSTSHSGRIWTTRSGSYASWWRMRSVSIPNNQGLE